MDQIWSVWESLWLGVLSILDYLSVWHIEILMLIRFKFRFLALFCTQFALIFFNVKSPSAIWIDYSTDNDKNWSKVSKFCRLVSWLTSVVFRDGSEDFAHGRLPFGLAPLHVVELDEDRVDLGHNRPDRLLHAVHAMSQSENCHFNRI